MILPHRHTKTGEIGKETVGKLKKKPGGPAEFRDLSEAELNTNIHGRCIHF